MREIKRLAFKRRARLTKKRRALNNISNRNLKKQRRNNSNFESLSQPSRYSSSSEKSAAAEEQPTNSSSSSSSSSSSRKAAAAEEQPKKYSTSSSSSSRKAAAAEEQPKKYSTSSSSSSSNRKAAAAEKQPKNSLTLKKIFYEMANSPSWKFEKDSYSYNTLTQVSGLTLYGTSLPPTEDDDYYDKCKKTFTYYMYRYNIKKLITFHSCIKQPDECRPEHLTMEQDAWNEVKNLHISRRDDPEIQYIEIDIKDMTAGKLEQWYQFIKFNFKDENNRIITHCLAGFGRTGWMMLLAALKHRIIDNAFPLSIFSHIGFFSNVKEEMYYDLREFASNFINITIGQSNSKEIRDRKVEFSINRMIREMFNISIKSHQILLVQRINTLILTLALYNRYEDNIYLYEKPQVSGEDKNEITLFNNPWPVHIIYNNSDYKLIGCEKGSTNEKDINLFIQT